jgi:hypothetical protein
MFFWEVQGKTSNEYSELRRQTARVPIGHGGSLPPTVCRRSMSDTRLAAKTPAHFK